MAMVGLLTERKTIFQESLKIAIQSLGYECVEVKPSHSGKVMNEQIDILIVDYDLLSEKVFNKLRVLVAPQIEILVFANRYEHATVDFLLRNKVKGILKKEISEEALASCLRALKAGDAYIDPALSNFMIQSYIEKQPIIQKKKKFDDPLSTREREVLHHMMNGMSDKEISEKLEISQITVRNHIQNVYKKTNTKNRVQLLLVCLENSWI